MSSTFQTASSENINFTKLFLIPANGEDAAGLAGVTTECREGRKTRNQCRGAPLGVRGPVAAVRRTCAGARARKRRAVWRPAVRGKLPPARTARRWVPASGSRPPGGLFVPSILTGWAAGMFKKSGRGNDSCRPSYLISVNALSTRRKVVETAEQPTGGGSKVREVTRSK